MTLTLNRPERLNALSREMIEMLIEAAEKAARDASVKAVILTGEGKAFCAGGDVKGMASSSPQTGTDREAYLNWAHRAPLAIASSPKVFIAAIPGPAMGAGLALACACDIRIASRSARLGTAFANVGLAGDFGISWSLTQLVGTARARELLLLSEIIGAQEALDLGLVNRVVDDNLLMESACDLATRIAAGPIQAFALMKDNLRASCTEPLGDVLNIEARNQIRALNSDDHKEAARAFVDKRKPIFVGH